MDPFDPSPSTMGQGRGFRARAERLLQTVGGQALSGLAPDLARRVYSAGRRSNFASVRGSRSLPDESGVGFESLTGFDVAL